MFERRLKILLGLFVAATLVLFGRAFTLQVVHGSEYAKAERAMSTRPPELTATTRGRILDRAGHVLAIDTACTDACVDYRAITDPPDAKWVSDLAGSRLRTRYGPDFRRQFPLDKRKVMLDEAKRGVEGEVKAMWATLALLYRPTDADAVAVATSNPAAALDEVRRSIVGRVEMRRRLLQVAAYRRSRDAAANAGGWFRWLSLSSNSGEDNPSVSAGPDIDAFQMTIEDQRQPHVVLRALDPEGCALLGKQLDKFPGLSLRPSTHRSYPLHDVACHLIGRVASPTAQELKRTENDDPTRKYDLADDVGRDGLEAMCEPLLRGVRGRIDRDVAGGDPVNRQEFTPGQDVHLTVDADLQARVQKLLQHVVIKDATGGLVTPAEGVSMHAAVVVLDVKTNEVLALASNPTFDVNDLETRYPALAGDTLEEPLRNRAVVDAMNPGSTAKPMVGIGAITQGVIGPHDGIECTGFLRLPDLDAAAHLTGKMTKFQHGRCWVASEYTLQQLYDATRNWPHPITSYAHHPIPTPHVGRFGNPDGFLCYADAIERSCNVYVGSPGTELEFAL